MADDLLSTIVVESRRQRRQRLIAAVIIIIVVLAIFSYVLARSLGQIATSSTVTVTTVPQGTVNSSLFGLVSQLNDTWNSTEINSSATNNSYNMQWAIGSLG